LQQPARKAARGGSQKHGTTAIAGSASHPDTTVSFTAELRKLKQHLQYARHTGRHCYINPISGEHDFQDVYKLTIWAKVIVSD